MHKTALDPLVNPTISYSLLSLCQGIEEENILPSFDRSELESNIQFYTET